MNSQPFTQRQLNDIIKECMGLTEEEPIPAIVSKQIARFTLSENMTYKEIGRCVWYYVNIRKKKIDSLYGIGFVPNIKKESADYWYNREIHEKERQKAAQEIVVSQTVSGNSVIFNINEIIKHQKQPTQLKPLEFDFIKEDKDGHK